MSAQHTPSPWPYTWEPVTNDAPYGHAKIGAGFLAKGVDGFDDRYLNVSGITVEADARLIAAAPDLLAALQEIERESANQDMSHKDFRIGAYQAAWSAIAKATGDAL